MADLDDLRKNIDRVDEVLVRLLNERARCACEIGRLKKELGVEIYQPEREKQVLDHVRGVAAEGPLGRMVKTPASKAKARSGER